MRDFREPADIYPKLTPGLGQKHPENHARGNYQGMNSATIAATIECKRIIDPSILELMLARNCPGLKGFNWQEYLDCSRVRIKRVLRALDHYKYGSFFSLDSQKYLDFGSWLGNFSLALKYQSYNVTAAEMWMRYSPSLDAQKKLLAENGVDCIDTTMIVGRPQGPTFDTVLFMSVIEHIQSSPRRILKILYDVLKPGGLLILDTPNLAYLPNRRALRRGRSPYVPIAQQFYTEEPFEGHNREYTAAELHWMLQVSGFEILGTDFFNYSPTPLSRIPVVDHFTLMLQRESPILDRLKMRLDRTKRELIFVVARKK